MIYQLKITLQHTKPPIWRRILVNPDMHLSEFHETIQIAFEWLDMHLHCFEARRTNGENLTDRYISIGINNEELLDFIDYEFDETEEKLSDWLVKEKDKLVYVYDFGDDWRHEIILEKILQPVPGMTYPYCVKAMKGSAEEDSGGFVDQAEDVDPKELLDIINGNLKGISEPVSRTTGETSATSENWQQLLRLAKQFNELAPWHWLDDDQIFAVQIPETNDFAYCSVMGRMGQEFGLAAFLGEEGLDYLKKILADPNIDKHSIYDNRSLVLSFCDRDEMTDKDYDVIKKAGITFRGKKKWPMFRSMDPGYYPWYLSNEEAGWFCVILERAIEVCKRTAFELEIEELSKSEACLAQVPIPVKNSIEWIDSYISILGKKKSEAASELFVDEVALQRLQGSFKKFNVPLEIGVFYSPSPVQENQAQKPYFPIVFAAIERKKQMVVFHEMLPVDDCEKRIQSALISLIEALGAIPREVWITNKTYVTIKPVLARLGISALVAEKLPFITELQNSMHQYFD